KDTKDTKDRKSTLRGAPQRMHPLRSSDIPRQAEASELPAGVGGEEVAVGRPDVRLRGGAGAAAQDHLAAHELPVILAQGTFQGTKARIGRIGAAGPFPHAATELPWGPV